MGLLDNILPGTGMDPADAQAARRQALIAAGAGMLQGASQRQGLGAIGSGLLTGLEGFHGAANRIMQMRMNDTKAKQAEALQQRRQAIARKYPVGPNTPREVALQNFRNMLNEFVGSGDEEMAAKLTEYLKSSDQPDRSQTAKPEGSWVTVPGPDGKPMRRYVLASEGPVEEYQRPQRDTDDAMTINSRFQNEERLLKNYEDRIEGVQTTVDAYQGALQASQMGGGAGDLQILYSFIRALDPGSVVREGEIALARQAMPLVSQAQIQIQKVQQGGALSPTERKQMLDLMKQMVDLKSQRADAALKDARGRAQRFGLDVELRDPLAAYRAAGAGASSASGPVARQAGETVEQYLARTRGR